MPTDDSSIAPLREALRVSPNNVPLRQLLAESLLKLGRYDEAEIELKNAIGLAPANAQLKLLLARAYFHQDKNSPAIVIAEELVQSPSPAPAAYILHARLLFRAGKVEEAVSQYKEGIAADAAVADQELAERLGVKADAASADDPNEEINDGRVRQAAASPLRARDMDIERPRINFNDIGGMEPVKEEIRMKIIHPITHAELYKAYGKTTGGGILMYGPPGCGKTHLARGTAGEIKASFLSVGINDVLDMWIGNSERNLHAIFDQARRSKPCVLFFDEVDALAASRNDVRGAGRHIINQFLSEMDGVSSDNDGVLILAATNAPWHMDSAFRRPGRFDRILFVPPPDAPARAAILRIHLQGKPLGEIDHDAVAKKTDGFSGADLKAAVDHAIEAKLREVMKSGGLRPLLTKDLISAAASVQPSTREWFASARNYALYSNQNGVYDDILQYLKK